MGICFLSKSEKKKKKKMSVAGLYKRLLPSPPAIEFASPQLQGKQLFSEALEGGTMEGFFKLISYYYQTQSEPAYCGLATLSVVLNALSIDPGEELGKIKAEGITFGKVACLAYCNGANVEAFRTNESSVDDFRRLVVSSTSSEDCHVIASYHRGVFKHFSYPFCSCAFSGCLKLCQYPNHTLEPNDNFD
ncbi:hypothetical protein EZV62_010850 [Acer yangbiense]|uniref:glutathione gamma-glutamylcysteinyltransferase n=1 Tax=Acer yangbiense TaxID=1000413 RepID=A0A5C7I5N1_9ROSI|nr:hypothetical protein EZV62_010850 [Acer yangbiense]